MVPNLKVSNITRKSFQDVKLIWAVKKKLFKIQVLIILVFFVLGVDPMKMTSDVFNNIKRKFGWK